MGQFYRCIQHKKEFLGDGYFNRSAQIAGRMLSFGVPFTKELLHRQLEKAIALRSRLFDKEKTNGFRLINGEGDFLPGLIIDQYDDVLVLQIGTLGMHRLRSWIVEWLTLALSPKAIYEKSLVQSRKEEGMQEYQGSLFGEVPAQAVIIRENHLQFYVSVLHGQKTGFFLDHREMRHKIQGLSLHKRVLNCFAYTGGFSVYAAAGKATLVDSVDISAAAIEMTKRNMVLNGFDRPNDRFFVADVFQFLREQPLEYEIVILDPPAFAKRQKDVVQACRGYKDINRLAMEKMPKNSLLLTSSCSYHVDEELFQKVVFQAAVESKREVQIIGHHSMAKDHPVNICHPESNYLKSLLLYLN